MGRPSPVPPTERVSAGASWRKGSNTVSTSPGGTPIEVFDGIRKSVLEDRAQYWLDLAEPFFGANHGRDVSYGAKLDFWRQGMLVNLAAAYDCVEAFSETDQVEDLKGLDVPILIAHGEDDLRDDDQRVTDGEAVEGGGYATLDGVLDRHAADVGGPAADRLDRRVDAGHRDRGDVGDDGPQGRFGEGPDGTEERVAQHGAAQ